VGRTRRGRELGLQEPADTFVERGLLEPVPVEALPGLRDEEMAKGDNRPTITLACTECKRRNYVTVKNRVNDRDRIELRKYCRWERKHTLHRETR